MPSSAIPLPPPSGATPGILRLRSTRPGRAGSERRIAWLFGLVAALVSFAGSWIPSFWGDEAASVLSAERPLPSLFRMLGHVDAVHGAYYLGLHAWIDVFGASPLSVRLPSALVTGVLTAGVYFLVRELRTRRFAVAAAVVVAILPRVTYFGGEARSYAFGAAVAVWAVFVLVRLVEGRATGRRWWVLYGVLMAAGVYTFLYFGLLVVVHAVVLLQARASRQTFRAWAVASGAAVVAASPVLVFGLSQHGQVSFLARSRASSVPSVLVSTWFGTVWFAVLGWGLIVVAVGFLVADVVRDRRVASAGGGGAGRPVSLTVLALAWLLIPLGILLAGNLVVADFTPRYVSYSAPAAAILLATGVVRLAGALTRTRREALVLAGALLAVVAVAAVPGYVGQRTPYAKHDTGWQSVSRVVGAHAAPGDAVVFDESTPTWMRPRLALTTYPDGFRGLRDVTLETPFAEADWWSSTAYTVDRAVALGRFDGVTRVWVVEARTDDYGLEPLARIGFERVASYPAHGATVVELRR